MAQVHRSRSQLKEQTRKYLNISLLLWGLLIVDLVLFLLYFKHYFMFMVIAAVIFTVSASYYYRQYTILKAGVNGEDKALKVVKRLPPGYHVFNNVPVFYNGQKGEVDLVVVGKTGIFSIEVKNIKGRIQGSEDDKDWLQTKISGKGNSYRNRIDNPTRQARKEVYLLSHNIKSKAWVQGMVWFTHKNSDLAVSYKRIPVMNSGKKVSDYITNYRPRKALNNHDVEVIKKQIIELQRLSENVI